MPLYEYQCESCAHRFELIQKYSDLPPEACPACGGAVRKLFSSPAIQFKGTGWYITDYARKGGTGAGKDQGSSSASSGDASSSGGESKSSESKAAESKPAESKAGTKE